MRHDAAGARKRYAGLVENGRETQVVFTAMEAVRSDWTDLAKEVQRELYARLFADQPIESYLRHSAPRRGGAEDGPAEAADDPLDYEHYLDKQIGAVAEPVLALLGLDPAEFLAPESSCACSDRTG